MKTLGQIAYEVAKVNQVSWDRVGDVRKSDWEAAAQAVREAVIEECAKVCDVTPPYPFRPSIEAAHAIRALKDKK